MKLESYFEDLRARLQEAKQIDPKISQGALARAARMSPNQLCQLMRGERDVRISTVVRLEKALASILPA